MARWRLDVAYDGTQFHGFAAQPGQRTVAGVLQLALERLCRLGGEPRLVCAGRTDAGVHATGQVVHVDLPDHLAVPRTGVPMTDEAMVQHLNAKLPDDVVVAAATVVGEDFDARFSATARHYRYLVDAGPVADPLLARLAWHVAGPIDRAVLDAATSLVVGEHDFRSFCRRVPGTTAADPIPRRVLAASWSTAPRRDAIVGAGSLLRFDVEANAFCHQMVRSLVGQLIAVGRGRATVDDVAELLASPDRHRAADPAPGHGLCLTHVTYGEAP